MEADEQEAGQLALKLEEKADQVQDAIKAQEAGQKATGSKTENIEQAAPNKADTGPADPKEEGGPPAEAPAQPDIGAESHQQGQPATGQDAEVAAADRAGTGAEGCAAAPQPQAAVGGGEEDMPDAAQGEPGTTAEHEEDAEAPAKTLGRQGSARGRNQRGRGKKGGRGKGAMPRKRSARSQAITVSPRV